jgi:outer membrane protein
MRGQSRVKALATNIPRLAAYRMVAREEQSCGGGFVRRAFVVVFLLAAIAFPSESQQLPNSPAPAPSESGLPASVPSSSPEYDARFQNQQTPDTAQPAPSNQATPANQGPTTVYPPGYKLTIQEAESIGLRNNPQITVGRLQALQAHQYVREVRSALLPTVNLNATGVEADPGGRLTAGYLTNGRIYPRVAGGVAVSQLVTDFGHTTNLVASSRYQAKEADENAIATKQDIILAVDQSFYNCLETQALQQVAEETVKARQLFEDQIQELTNAKLKSEVDLAFAKVDLARAQLLLLDAQDNYQASLSTLSAILGFSDRQEFAPQEPSVPVTPPAQDAGPLIQQALDLRPEVRSLRNAVTAAQKFARSEHDLWWPTVTGMGVVGGAPVRDSYVSSWYGGAGVNVSIPVFNGFLFNARIKSADLATHAQQKRLQDLQDNVARDVRNGWLQTQDAYKRLSVTELLRQQAQLALELAQARYKLGLGSIVEFTQAEMQKTDADIQDTDAHYRYIVSQIVLAYQMGLTR